MDVDREHVFTIICVGFTGSIQTLFLSDPMLLLDTAVFCVETHTFITDPTTSFSPIHKNKKIKNHKNSPDVHLIRVKDHLNCFIKGLFGSYGELLLIYKLLWKNKYLRDE